MCSDGVAVRPTSESVEIFEHLPPRAVDRAVAFVGDDEIEALDRETGVVGDDLFALLAVALERRGLLLVLRQFLAGQHRVDALDRGDHDLRILVEAAAPSFWTL